MRNYFKLNLICLCLFTIFSKANAQSAEWFDAAKAGDLWKLSSLVFNGTSVNAPDQKGSTALHIAAQEGNMATLNWLLGRKDIDINARNAAGETALMLAIIRGQDQAGLRLLEKGASVNQVGWTPLHYAAASEAKNATGWVRALLEKHAAYIDAQSPNKTTPLMMAARYGLTSSVKALIDAGADPELKNELGLDALAFAQQGKRPDSVPIIEEVLTKLRLAREAEAARRRAEEAAEAARQLAAKKAAERQVVTAAVKGSMAAPEGRTLGAAVLPVLPEPTLPPDPLGTLPMPATDDAWQTLLEQPDESAPNNGNTPESNAQLGQEAAQATAPTEPLTQPLAQPATEQGAAAAPVNATVSIERGEGGNPALPAVSVEDVLPPEGPPRLELSVPDSAFGVVIKRPPARLSDISPEPGAGTEPADGSAPAPAPAVPLKPSTEAPMGTSILARQPYSSASTPNIGGIFRVEPPAPEETPAETPLATESSAPTTDAPATETPATETPATETPATETPATETPATETPATETPATETRATETPATETPATETPATETPATETPATETPATETPATETPATETPAALSPIEVSTNANSATVKPAAEQQPLPIPDTPQKPKLGGNW